VASSFEVSAKVLKNGGTFILLGPPQPDDSPAAKILSEKKGKWVQADLVQYSKEGVTTEVQRTRIAAGLYDARRYIEQGQLRPVIQTIGWSELLNALLEIQKGRSNQGKLVFDLSKQ